MTSTDSHDHRDGGHAHGHSHAPGSGADKRYLLIALALLAAFMLGELIVAVISGSLALLSDAGHMLSDVGAIGGALWAIRLAGRPATRGLDLRLETRRDPLCCR
jgi:cobalt-zinc-cadmium efflux system protein